MSAIYDALVLHDFVKEVISHLEAKSVLTQDEEYILEHAQEVIGLIEK